MFEILRKSLATGVVTSDYPRIAPEVAANARGLPEIDYAALQNPQAAVDVCATGALTFEDKGEQRTVHFDLGRCTFCGFCAEIEPAIKMTNACQLAVLERRQLVTTAKYKLNGTPKLLAVEAGNVGNKSTEHQKDEFERVGNELKSRIQKVLGRSLHIREVDAGSCNGCEIEIVGLNSPVYDIERFGIHFVASPRHADMLLVTGPVARNMELALKKTYAATPDPRVVVAVGACGCSGGMFGVNYATRGAVDEVIPVDVYIPGCPPNPCALLDGILLAIGRVERKQTQRVR